MKHFIFNHLLPDFIKKEIIFKKKGVDSFNKVKVSDKITIDYVLPIGNNFWIERLSKQYGHEPLVVRFYEQFLKKEDIVFDIGVQMGYFPSIISSLIPSVEIHGFEGNWLYVKYLKINKKLNDKQNKWVINPVFVASSKGVIEGIKAISMDEYCANNKITPTIMQMDVDGEEYNIMKGAQSLLKNNITEFLIEVHPTDLKKRGIEVDAFLSLFHSQNIELKYLPDFRLQGTKWVSDYNLVNKTEEFYIYAAPKNKVRF